MKIAVDIDEVLIDYLGNFLDFYNEAYQTSFTKNDFSKGRPFYEVLGLDENDERRHQVGKAYELSPYSENGNFVAGAQEGIKKLQQNNELVIISNRDPRKHDSTRKWLHQNFPKAFQEVYFTEAEVKDGVRPTKASICKRIGATLILEDTLIEAEACSKEGIKVILFNTHQNQGELPDGVTRIHSWPEAVRLVRSYT